MHFKQSLDENSFELNLEVDAQLIEQKPEFSFYEAKSYQEQENIAIPCSVFQEGLSGLEAIIKYLKEEQKLSFSEISKLLNRDPRTVWTTYNKTKTKQITKIKKLGKATSFSTEIIKKRNYSVLESVAQHLKNKGLTVKEISEELGRNKQTIWTVLRRAKEKNKQSEVAQ